MRVTLPESIPGNARRQLRSVLAARRRSAPAAQRTEAALRVTRNVDREVQLRSRRRIAVYAALPEELDTAPLIALARRRGCRIYLPRIARHAVRRDARPAQAQSPGDRRAADGGDPRRALAGRGVPAAGGL